MSGSGDLHEQLARRLRAAEDARRAIPPLVESEPGLTIADAYAVQRCGRLLRLEAGERLVGRKVGLTSRAMQEMLDVDQPDYGGLLESMVIPSGSTVDTARLIAPRVEAEVAFVLDRAPVGPQVTRDGVLAATRAVVPSLEVIDSRIMDWRITIVDTIADNASSAMAVLGAELALDDLDLERLEVELAVGPRSERGRGDAVLGHPAEPVAWLANALADYGEELEPGDVVLPGALCRAIPVEPGQVARADFGPLGAVSVTFE